MWVLRSSSESDERGEARPPTNRHPPTLRPFERGRGRGRDGEAARWRADRVGRATRGRRGRGSHRSARSTGSRSWRSRGSLGADGRRHARRPPRVVPTEASRARCPASTGSRIGLRGRRQSNAAVLRAMRSTRGRRPGPVPHVAGSSAKGGPYPHLQAATDTFRADMAACRCGSRAFGVAPPG
jgi:hypothetical protein